MLQFVSLLLFILASAPSFALGMDTPLADKGQEARARTLFHELRCVVCQGQSLADSQADIAVDMRRLIRDMITRQSTDADIRTYLASRYGDDILMQPPLTPGTAPLWFLPALIPLLTGLILVRRYRRSRT